MLSATLLAAAALAAGTPTEPLYEDDKLGRQMTVAEMEHDLIGNTLAWDGAAGRNALYPAIGGTLKGRSARSGPYAITWHFRDYDNLFCADSGNPASSGCVQVLRKGQQISFRRKDGLIEFTADLLQGNPQGL